MSIQTLSTLENAVEPYRQAGYIITSQTNSAITLRAPVRKFSWGLFLTGLFLFWPVAIVYLIRFNQQKDRIVCVRITSQDQIEATGFTLSLLESEQQQRSLLSPSYIAMFLVILGAIIGLILLICWIYQ